MITGNATASTRGLAVDTVTGAIFLAPGLIAQTAPITIPVTATTAIRSLRATGLDNSTGTFSIRGGLATATIPTEIRCTSASPPARGIGCVGATGLGGQMALSGMVFIRDVPRIVTPPVPMWAAGIGGLALLHRRRR